MCNSGTVSLTNTIVANQVAGTDCSRDPITSLGHNLDSDGTCGLGSVGDQPSTDPLLGPLQDNGGPTKTHALRPGGPGIGSPAIDDDGLAEAWDHGVYSEEVAAIPLVAENGTLGVLVAALAWRRNASM